MGDSHDETTVTTTSRSAGNGGDKMPFLLVLTGGSLGRSWRIDETSCVVGRGSDADFQLDDEGISRRHAKVVRLPEGVVMIKDMGSTNGTFVNDNPISAHPLSNGDKIRLGASTTLRSSLEDEVEVQVRQHLFAAATRDALTQVHNKRSFDEEIMRATAFSRRHKQPVSLIVFDLDHFKNVNDTHGHVVGDEVLKKVARRVAEAIRLEDALARIGGEEFAVILPGIDEEHAILAAERLRTVICSAPVDSDKGPLDLSISCGVAEYNRDQHEKVEALIAEADRQLYAAKHAGRNCVRPSPPRNRKVFRDAQTLIDGDNIQEIARLAKRKRASQKK